MKTAVMDPPMSGTLTSEHIVQRKIYIIMIKTIKLHKGCTVKTLRNID